MWMARWPRLGIKKLMKNLLRSGYRRCSAPRNPHVPTCTLRFLAPSRLGLPALATVFQRLLRVDMKRAAFQGFTLLEVMVAMTVLAVALVSLLGLHNRNLFLTMSAVRLNTATLLAREMLTRTQLEGTAATRATSGDFEDLYPGRYPEFRWARTLSQTPIQGLWEVRVSVAWGERVSEMCELTLFTKLGAV